MEAIATSGRVGQIVVMGHEMMDPTRAALIDGVLTLVIAHPLARLAADCAVAMTQGGTAQRLIGFDIYTAENI